MNFLYKKENIGLFSFRSKPRNLTNDNSDLDDVLLTALVVCVDFNNLPAQGENLLIIAINITIIN